MRIALVFASVLLLGGLSALGELSTCWAGVGKQLAQLMGEFAPVEVYRQQLALWRLAGGEPPVGEAARAGLTEASRTIAGLASGFCGVDLSSALQTASVTLAAAFRRLGMAEEVVELPQAELDEYLGALSQARAALDGLVLAAAETAEAAGGGWEFQAAFLAQTVLISPSPLYLNIPEEWQAYLRRNLPPDFPAEGVQALDRLLELANRGLTEGEQEEARRAAEELLRLLVEGGA